MSVRLPDKHWVGRLVVHPCVLLNFCLHFDWIFNQACLPVRKGARLLGSQSSICFGAQARNHGIRNTFSHPCIFPSHTMFQPGSHWLCQAIHNTILKHGIVIHIMFYFWMIHKNLKYGWNGNPRDPFWKCQTDILYLHFIAHVRSYCFALGVTGSCCCKAKPVIDLKSQNICQNCGMLLSKL